MIRRGWNSGRRCRRRLCREVTLVMMMVVLLLRGRWLLGLLMRMVVVMVLLLRLLLMIVVGHRVRRELGGIVASPARVHRAVVTLLVHFNTEHLEFLSGVPRRRVGLLEARQGC